jgi:hypothetical protein
MGKHLDLLNQVFGRLTVVEKGASSAGNTIWVCKCECGNIKNIRSYDLRRPKYPVRSCGCLKKELTKKLALKRKGPRPEEQKNKSIEAYKREIKFHNHYEQLINNPKITKKTCILYSNQQPVEIILQDIRHIEEVQIPLGTHKYSTITTFKPKGPGLISYNVIETKKEIMDVNVPVE